MRTVSIDAGAPTAASPHPVAADPGANGNIKPSSKHAPVSYLRLFSAADGLDFLLLFLGTLGALANGAMLPLFSILFGDFANAFGSFLPPCYGVSAPGMKSTQQFLSDVNDVALRFFFLSLGAAAAGCLQQGCWSYTGARQSNRLRSRFLQAVLKQDIAFYDTQATTGGLLQGLNEDSLAVQQAISDKMGAFLQHITTFVVGYIVAFWRGWDMTLVMVGCLPFLAAAGSVLARVATTMGNKQAEAYTEAGAVVQQQLSQVRTVTAYNGQEAAVKEYDDKLDKPLQVGQRASIIQGMSLGSMQFVMFCSYAIALFYGAHRIAAGAYTGGDVLNVMMCCLMGSFSVGMAAPSLEYFSKGQAAAGRMFAIINRKPSIDASSGEGERPKELEGCIELQQVSFAYPARPDVQVFRDFSLVVPAGKTVALVGSSGSGKSTIIGLLERYYDPCSGRVLLDGRDLRTLNLGWLRTHVGLVSQEPTLFANSIYENIAIGREGATREEVEAAARSANAWTFINAMPEKFDTKVGERGVQLSGGQKQRIAIARAILKNPKVLLLDEATSALDAESERIVQDALDRLVVGRTTVVVAHRLSTIQGADTIAVVRAGQLVEQGTHAQLLQDPEGAYTCLVKLQMQRDGEHAPSTPSAAGTASSPFTALYLTDGLHTDSPVHCVVSTKDGEQGVTPGDTNQAGQTPTSTNAMKRKPTIEEALQIEAREAAAAIAQAASGLEMVTVDDGTALAAAGPAAAASPAAFNPAQLQLAADTSAAMTLQVARVGPVRPGAPGLGLREASVFQRLASTLRNRRIRDTAGGEGTATGAAAAADRRQQDQDDAEAAEKAAAEAAAAQVSFKRLLAINRPEWSYGIVGVLASLIVGGVQPAFAFVFSSMISIFYLRDMDELKAQASRYCSFFVVIATGMLTFVSIQQYSFAVMGQRLARRMRVLLFKATLRQDIGWFDLDANSSGKLAACLATDASHIRGAVGDVAALAFQNLSVLVVGYVVACIHDWRMALLVTGAAPLVAVGGFLRIRFMVGASSGSDKLYSEANQTVSEAVASIRVIQAYRLEGYVDQLYRHMLQGTNKEAFKASLAGGIGLGYATMTMYAIYALITWFGGLEVSSCRATFQQFLTAFMAVIFAAMGASQAQVGFPDIAKAKGAVGRVFRVVDRSPPIDSAAEGGLAPAGSCTGHLELRHVVFAYPSRPSVTVFNNFCLDIPAGKTVALVGESGSGKSTVVGLVERFYDPASGTVLLDGIDLKSYNLRWLRSQIALVSQEPLLFSCSIADNIRYGRPDATVEEVRAAAAAANALEFIDKLPEGLDTSVGERGVQLSGGQKQRVAIARAVVKDPKILLLDEATSALDASSERLVQAALDKIMVGRTSVVVAHRLSTIKNADTIAVVYRGVILEQGSHEELLAVPGGGYARLVAAQMKNH